MSSIPKTESQSLSLQNFGLSVMPTRKKFRHAATQRGAVVLCRGLAHCAGISAPEENGY